MVSNELIEKSVAEYFKENHSNLVITKRISESLVSMIRERIESGDIDDNRLYMELNVFFENEHIVHFVERRQPNTQTVPDSVAMEVVEYFDEFLEGYTPKEVYRSTNHPDDSSLYMVLAEAPSGEFACWTSWNDDTKSLNQGHYNLPDYESAKSILKYYYKDISHDDKEMFGIDRTKKQIEEKEPRMAVATGEITKDNIIPMRRRGRH